ncbi:Dehydrogenase E1 component, partial [Penicillium atrosanguineum]
HFCVIPPFDLTPRTFSAALDSNLLLRVQHTEVQSLAHLELGESSTALVRCIWHRQRYQETQNITDTAITRIEQLHPVPWEAWPFAKTGLESIFDTTDQPKVVV